MYLSITQAILNAVSKEPDIGYALVMKARVGMYSHNTPYSIYNSSTFFGKIVKKFLRSRHK